ncbi:cupin domain-containing protein, partial [Okeania sp. SIO2G5]|uniref:cupin domain-containing protein n=1 Tax=Okeania sp. SIO2G5 TaxID=2607796 RepID=UPI00257AF628
LMKYVDINQLPIKNVSHNPAIKKQVMLNTGDVSNLIYFSQACFKPGHIAAGHSHNDMSEIFFVEKGEGTITVNETVHRLETGVCVAVHPGDVHEISNTGTND